ncbi:hypothetical protein EDC18_103312 [Natranaerovirga pectinivora]|uniref:Uncharacterized protein n=1 Tax=Natranaerovirga pectinivora TaxID=682400 RepID=A0A4R3MNI5_9FIRM|nr:hypothetical protein [Natranaerovirga pectinivora]TCT15604.1 hypothetical protein EDC18_103312 [Natranaerovirga pectinivora]
MENIFYFLLGSLYLFAIVYLAVRFAIKPTTPDIESSIEEKTIIGLRDLGLFDTDETYEILKIFELKSVKKKEDVKFESYLNVLTELKNLEYIDSEQLQEKIKHLKGALGN